MRTRRRRLPRTRAAARLPGSLKFGVTNDASANPCDGKSGFTRRAPRHRAGAVLTSMRRVGPRVLFIDDIVLYRDDARQPLCLGFGRLSRRGHLLRTHERNYPLAARECSEPSGRLGARPRAARVVPGAKQVIPELSGAFTRPGGLIYGCAKVKFAKAAAPQRVLTKRA